MTTSDQHGRAVLDFYRCAMLPLALDAPDTGLDDDMDDPGSDLSRATSALRDLVLDELDVPSQPRVAVGDLIEVVGGTW